MTNHYKDRIELLQQKKLAMLRQSALSKEGKDIISADDINAINDEIRELREKHGKQEVRPNTISSGILRG